MPTTKTTRSVVFQQHSAAPSPLTHGHAFCRHRRHEASDTNELVIILCIFTGRLGRPGPAVRSTTPGSRTCELYNIIIYIPSHPEDKIPNHGCARSVTVRQTLINAQIYSATRSCVEGDALTRRRPRTHREASVLASNDPADTIGRPLLPPRTTREATAVVVAH